MSNADLSLYMMEMVQSQKKHIADWMRTVVDDIQKQLQNMVASGDMYWAVYSIGENYEDASYFDVIRRFDFHLVKTREEKERLISNYLHELNRKTIHIAIVFPINISEAEIPQALFVAIQGTFKTKYFCFNYIGGSLSYDQLSNDNPYQSAFDFLNIFPARVSFN